MTQNHHSSGWKASAGKTLLFRQLTWEAKKMIGLKDFFLSCNQIWFYLTWAHSHVDCVSKRWKIRSSSAGGREEEIDGRGGEMREVWRLSTSWGNTATGRSKIFVVKFSFRANENVCVEKFKTSTQEIRRLFFTDRNHTSSHTHHTDTAKDKFFLTPWVRLSCKCAALAL